MPWLSARQLLDWQRYEREVGYRDDWHWGLIAAILANQHRGKNQQPAQVADMMIYYDPPPIDASTLKARLGRVLKRKD